MGCAWTGILLVLASLFFAAGAEAQSRRVSLQVVDLTYLSSLIASAAEPPYVPPLSEAARRRPAYMITVGAGLIAGALVHTLALGRHDDCGYTRRAARVVDGAFAATGAVLVLAGGFELHLAASVRSRRSPVGIVATFLGTAAISFAMMSVPNALACSAS
jgi:hypothetical protein